MKVAVLRADIGDGRAWEPASYGKASTPRAAKWGSRRFIRLGTRRQVSRAHAEGTTRPRRLPALMFRRRRMDDWLLPTPLPLFKQLDTGKYYEIVLPDFW